MATAGSEGFDVWRRGSRHGWDRKRWGHRSERRYRIVQRTYHVLLAFMITDLLVRWLVVAGAPEWLRDATRIAGTVLVLGLIVVEVITQWRDES